MSFSDLLTYNPWWVDQTTIQKDRQILAFNASKITRDYQRKAVFEPGDYIYSLRGPRQVGKTTLIKLKIQKLLEKHSPKNVLYYSFEEQHNLRDVVDILNEYFRRINHEKNEQHFIFLDELSNVVDWQKAIKKLKDLGRLDKCTIVVTGSHSLDLRHGAETLPGRRGTPINNPLDQILSPMVFREFFFSSNDLPEKLLLTEDKRITIIKKLMDGEIADELYELTLHQNELDTSLKNYSITGGMATPINTFFHDGHIPNSVFKNYFDYLIMNFKSSYDKDIFFMLIHNIIKKITTPISLRSLATNLDNMNNKITSEYLSMLTDLYLLKNIYNYDINENLPNIASNKKLFFTDSFFYHTLNIRNFDGDAYIKINKLIETPEYQSKIIKQTVANHCIQLAYNTSSNKEYFETFLNLFYWKGKSREVDFLVRVGKSLLPIEVKYQNKINSTDIQGLIDYNKAGKTKFGLLLTKDEMKIRRETVHLPVSLFLALI